MTEHLPECPVEKMLRSGRTVGSQSCICEHLRACEERVEESIDRAWQQAAQLAVAHARTATLDAAREAVAAKAMHSPKCFALLPDFDERDCNCAVAYSLAAIDALREEQK